MADDHGAGMLEQAFRLARLGDMEAFARWMGMVEMPLRRSLRRFARAVDVEVAVQETLVRMWLVAGDPERRLSGPDASLKFAFRVARNVAMEEMRRTRQERFVDLGELDGLPEGIVAPDPPDPALRRAIEDCIRRLPRQPRKALTARAGAGARADRELAAGLHMKLNTFLQNIVRARKLLADCLERRGVRLAEILS
jgi:DNA-directed RNA polymerase specialized sigma24 family protein